MLRKLGLSALFYFVSITSVYAAGAYVAASLAYMKVYVSDSDKWHGLAPKFALGYGDFAFGSFYLAGEIFGLPFKPATTSSTTSDGNSALKPSWSYGASLLAGVNLDGAVKFFGRLSWLETNFQYYGTLTGAQGGIGLEANLYSGWAVRGELIRTQYYTSAGTAGRPKVDEGDIGVIYRFGVC